MTSPRRHHRPAPRRISRADRIWLETGLVVNVAFFAVLLVTGNI